MKKIRNIVFVAPILILTACGNSKGDYDASGIFETTEVLISAEATGKLMEFNLQEGQIIGQDSVLGYIDTIQLSLKKKQLLASMGAVESRQTDIPKQIAALQQQITTQKKEKQRFEKLVQANAANQKQVDDIQSQIQILEKQLVAQTESFENSNRGVGQESSSMNIQIEQLDDQIAKSFIKSPIKGTILSKYAERGELATQGKALFKVADVENLFLRAYIVSSQLTQIKIGQTVKVYSDLGESDRKEYAGTVTWISDKAEFTPKTIQTRDERANLVYAVKIAVKNDGYLKRGMYGEIKFQ